LTDTSGEVGQGAPSTSAEVIWRRPFRAQAIVQAFILRNAIFGDEHHAPHRSARDVHFSRMWQGQRLWIGIGSNPNHQFTTNDSEAHVAAQEEGEPAEHPSL
jgi:hypothetical protein